MDKALLKKFAIESRQDLMEKIKNKINTFYVNENFKNEQRGDLYILSNDKHTLSLTNNEYKKRELLIKRINELGIEQVIEEAAYTWFNRIVAIRYMEINDYLPLTKDNQSLGIRVLSSKDNTPDPEIMKFTNLMNPDLNIDFKKEKYVELKNDNEKFKYVLLLVCKKLGRVIPQVFDGITDYIDILIPDNLLNDTGFVNKIVSEVSENNYNQVEIIGWLYQYYNQTEKDRVISAKKQYKKNEIAYATQLFTPDWIVKYMVENSLGRYWIEHGGDKNLIKNWKYFIKDNIQEVSEKIMPTEIKCIDPCSGSGHILVYMFEVLYQIYLSYGYSKNDIAEQILKNNLYGLDIDDRAGQLSILSVLLKAREYDKNIFNKDIVRNLNIMSIQESNNINDFIIDNISNDDEKNKTKYLIDNFKNAKEIGSLLILENNDYRNLEKEIENNNTIFGIELRDKLIPLINNAKILSNKYDIVVTNPPYLSNSVMSSNLKKYIQEHYENVKSDLFAAFIIRNSTFEKNETYLGLMTPMVWMFISSYDNLRKYIIEKLNITSLIQLEYSALEEATVPICTFILNNTNNNQNGIYFRLTDYKGGMERQKDKYIEILNEYNSKNKFDKNINEFKKIPAYTIAYWINENTINNFERKKAIKDYVKSSVGIQTGDNDKFLHYWWEISYNDILFGINDTKDTFQNKKWFPYNKGGEYRKWFGNDEYVIDWKDDGKNIKKNSELTKHHYQQYADELKFKRLVTWSRITSGTPSFRYKDNGFLSDMAGFSIFSDEENLKKILAFCNSNVAKHYLEFMAPTLNIMISSVISMPYSDIEDKKLVDITNQNLLLAKEDWDSFETSWDFITHPLIEYKTGSGYDKDIDKWDYKIKDAYESWKFNCDEKFKLLKKNEEELNKIFIDIYGLQDELTPDVEDKDITIRKADRGRDIKSLISYAVGCMFGRYSLDQDGLVYAGGDFDKSKYKTFTVDEDNIIPITDEAYFGDDIVERFKKFIKVVYGDNTFNENMEFIAETLGKKGTETSEDTIRRYFLNDFFNDHVKIYQKRPIYWLFDSGKKNGFKALIYMHRFNENLIPKVRLDYLHRIQTTYEKLLSDVNYKLTTDLSLSDKKAIQNRQADLNAKLNEIKEYDEKIAHIANQRINIDLDDGVKINYDKFNDILAKIK